MARAYYKLDEASELLGHNYKPADLIYLGAHGSLPIYVLAADWDVGVRVRGNADAIDDEIGVAPAAYPPFRATFSDRLTGYQRLHTKTLTKFLAEPEATVRNFIVERTDDEGSSTLYEYQLGGNADELQYRGHLIKEQNLVVMAEDILALPAGNGKTAQTLTEAQTSDLTQEKPKRKAPDDFVAVLIGLLVEIAKRAKAEGLDFTASAMPGRKKDFQALADKFDPELRHTPKTFDTYLSGLCQFKSGAPNTDFYVKLFPELLV